MVLKDKPAEQVISQRTKEKWFVLQSSFSTTEYWQELTELLSQTQNKAELEEIKKMLQKNPLIDGEVLFKAFRLIEGVQLWHLHQGKPVKIGWGDKRNPAHIAKLFLKLTEKLNDWDDDLFTGSNHLTAPEQSRDLYKPAAQFILSTSAVLFASLPTLSSPDVKAQTTRMALALLDREAAHASYLRTLLTDRAAVVGAKEDIGEDAFYETLTQLIAGWSPEQRAAITKQLGDLLAVAANPEQNDHIHIPITQNMANLAVLLLFGIRQHNQNDADFANPNEPEKAKKQATVSNRGGELSTEPVLAMVSLLKKSADKGVFNKEVAQQLFEAMMGDIQLANPAVLLRIIETFAHPKLREALQKAYSRRDTKIPMSATDDVLMYLLTGTFTNHAPHATYSLNDQGLQFATDSIGTAGYASMLADFIRATAKFGLHTANGLNPLPQMYSHQSTQVIDNEKLSQPMNVKNLNIHLDASGANTQQLTNIHRLNKRFISTNTSETSIIGTLITSRKELSLETRESLKMRMRRWLEVEQQLWLMIEAAANENSYHRGDTTQLEASWMMYFTTGINLLTQPNSESFKIDPTLIKEFAPALAERIVARRIAIEKGTQVRGGDHMLEQLKTFANWAINQAAGHWDKTLTDAVFDQVKVQVGKDDGQYFTSLIPDFINNITLEAVAKTEGAQPGYRTENQAKAISTLVELLVNFSRNTSFVGTESRGSIIQLLENISGDLSGLIKKWDPNKEYRYLNHLSAEYDHPRDRELAAVARLLDLLAGHSGSSEITQATQGQTQVALAINAEIGKEIGVLLQAIMPSSTLMENLLNSRMKLEKQQLFVKEKNKDLIAAARTELENVKRASKKGKLSLAAIKKLIGSSLGSLGEGIIAAKKLEFNFTLPKAETTDEPTIDIHTFLAHLAHQYLSKSPATEIAPLGQALADILRQEYEKEEMATQPIDRLREKIAVVLGKELEIPLEKAVAQEAELEAQRVLAESMKRYFDSADLLLAIENARLTKEDLQEVKVFFEKVRMARTQVTSASGMVEKSLAKIRKNLAPILGQATHLITMPKWEQIAWFIPDDVFSAAIEENAKKA